MVQKCKDINKITYSKQSPIGASNVVYGFDAIKLKKELNFLNQLLSRWNFIEFIEKTSQTANQS